MGHEAEEKRRVIIQTLIDGEVSASETYRQALERAADASGLGALRRIEGDHRQAARVLKERCRAAGSAAAAPWGD